MGNNTMVDNKKVKDLIIINIVLLCIFEFFLGLVYFEWSQSINIKMNCLISAGVITVVAIILLALGIGNKSKDYISYGLETLVLAGFTMFAYYSLTVIQAPLMIGRLSIYTVIPFVLFFVYYIIKMIVIAKNRG